MKQYEQELCAGWGPILDGMGKTASAQDITLSARHKSGGVTPRHSVQENGYKFSPKVKLAHPVRVQRDKLGCARGTKPPLP